MKNLKSLHTHQSPISDSSPHSKRHGPNSAIPNTASLPCHPERSHLHPVIPIAPPSCHLERSAAVYPVILNAAQRSEESKSVAPAAISHFRFLPSLEMTGANFCYSERILSLRTAPFCHSFQAAPYPVIPNGLPSVIPNAPSILSFRPRHSEHSEESKTHDRKTGQVILCVHLDQCEKDAVCRCNQQPCAASVRAQA